MFQLMPIPEVSGVFTEAFLLDDYSETVFISFIEYEQEHQRQLESEREHQRVEKEKK